MTDKSRLCVLGFRVYVSRSEHGGASGVIDFLMCMYVRSRRLMINGKQQSIHASVADKTRREIILNVPSTSQDRCLLAQF